MIRDNISLQKCEGAKYIKLKVDDVEVSWDDNTCEPIYKRCH